MFIILGFPHLVLTDVRNDKCLSFGQVPEIIDDMSCPELATIRQKLDVSHCSITFEQPLRILEAIISTGGADDSKEKQDKISL